MVKVSFAVKLLMEIEPLLPPHDVGFVPITVALVGVAGFVMLLTVILIGNEGHSPVKFCVTLIVKLPAVNGVIVVVFIVEVTKPAFGEEADQLYVAPATLVTLKLMVDPTQTGFGFAIKLSGAFGEIGFNNEILPVYSPDAQLVVLIMVKFEYDPVVKPVMVATPELLLVTFTVAGWLSLE